MRHALSSTLALAMALILAGGCDSSDPYEAAAEKTVAKAKEYTTIMASVKTASDAESAVPKLEALAKDFEAIAADIKKQPKMTDAQKTKVKAVFDGAKGEMDKMSDSNQITDPEVGMKVMPAAMKAGFALMDVAMQLKAQGADVMGDMGPGGAGPAGE